MPSARRRLVCLGKSMRSGVFWHFNDFSGGSVQVHGKGHWGKIVLAENDLLFLDASVVPPMSQKSARNARDMVPAPTSVEISHAELHHRRLGHPGRTAIKNLVRLKKIPKEASDPLPDHCRVCMVGKAHMIPRQPQQCPATRCLERLHVDLMCKIRPKGFGGEENILVVTDEFSGYVEAIP
jgi:hypothetical protein